MCVCITQFFISCKQLNALFAFNYLQNLQTNNTFDRMLVFPFCKFRLYQRWKSFWNCMYVLIMQIKAIIECAWRRSVWLCKWSWYYQKDWAKRTFYIVLQRHLVFVNQEKTWALTIRKTRIVLVTKTKKVQINENFQWHSVNVKSIKPA